MLNKIQTIVLDGPPAKVCDTTAELSSEMQKFGKAKICMFLGVFQDHYYIMYTSFYDDSTVNVNEAVAFAPPCPPYCGKGGGGNEPLYVWV